MPRATFHGQVIAEQCPWKGAARYCDVVVDGERAAGAARAVVLPRAQARRGGDQGSRGVLARGGGGGVTAAAA